MPAHSQARLGGWVRHLSALLRGDESVLYRETQIKEQVPARFPDTAQVIGSGSQVRTSYLPIHGEKPMGLAPGTHQTPGGSGEDLELFLKFQFGSSLF